MALIAFGYAGMGFAVGDLLFWIVSGAHEELGFLLCVMLHWFGGIFMALVGLDLRDDERRITDSRLQSERVTRE